MRTEAQIRAEIKSIEAQALPLEKEINAINAELLPKIKKAKELDKKLEKISTPWEFSLLRQETGPLHDRIDDLTRKVNKKYSEYNPLKEQLKDLKLELDRVLQVISLDNVSVDIQREHIDKLKNSIVKLGKQAGDLVNDTYNKIQGLTTVYTDIGKKFGQLVFDYKAKHNEAAGIIKKTLNSVNLDELDKAVLDLKDYKLKLEFILSKIEKASVDLLAADAQLVSQKDKGPRSAQKTISIKEMYQYMFKMLCAIPQGVCLVTREPRVCTVAELITFAEILLASDQIGEKNTLLDKYFELVEAYIDEKLSFPAMMMKEKLNVTLEMLRTIEDPDDKPSDAPAPAPAPSNNTSNHHSGKSGQSSQATDNTRVQTVYYTSNIPSYARYASSPVILPPGASPADKPMLGRVLVSGPGQAYPLPNNASVGKVYYTGQPTRVAAQPARVEHESGPSKSPQNRN